MNELKIGSKAPPFSVNDQDGKPVSLKDYLGKRVVLFFYPKDLTPGCTQEACDFRDSFSRLEKDKVVVLGISRDNEDLHKKFIKAHDLNFSLLADTNGEICEKYGVIQMKNMYGRKSLGIVRTTYIIGSDGKIAKIYPKVKVTGHVDEILGDLGQIS